MKPRRELYEEVYNKYGIKSTSNFHGDLEEELSEEEYEKHLELWRKLSEIDWDDLDDDEDDDF